MKVLACISSFVFAVSLSFVLGVASATYCPAFDFLCKHHHHHHVVKCPCGEASCTCNDKCPCPSKDCIKKGGCCDKK